MAVSASLPLIALWLYEGSNWIAVAAQGNGVSLSMSGWFPLGVSSASPGGLSPLTKALQVLMSTGLLLGAGAIISRARLFFAGSLVVAFVAVYIASAYWEMLSLLASLPLALHEGIFFAGTGVISIALLKSFGPRFQRSCYALRPAAHRE